jgi:acyl-CoA reductase-like NAD-dependent aldehyde dehydrogenase
MTFDVFNPSTLEVLTTLNYHSLDEVKALIQKMNHTVTLSKVERIARLEKLLTRVSEQKHKEEFIQIALREGGKPYKDTVVEVERGLNGIAIAINALKNEKNESVPMGINQASVGKSAYVIRQPIGPVLAISAFNHPFNLFIHQVIPALAIGTPVIYKPDLRTPMTSLRFEEHLRAIGVSEDEVKVALLTNDHTQKIAELKDIRFLSFIGSEAVGWKLSKVIANGTRLLLEHGGMAAAIVESYDDLSVVAKKLARASMSHAGQVCISLQHIFVKKELRNELETKFKEELLALVVGNSDDTKTDIGPMIDEKAMKRSLSVLENTKAKTVKGESPKGNFIPATLVLDPSLDSEIFKTEIFAPVVTLNSYDNLDELVNFLNEREVRFQNSFFTTNMKLAEKMVYKFRGSTLLINEHPSFRVDWMPFGGHRLSGLGIGGIEQTMHKYSEEQLIIWS